MSNPILALDLEGVLVTSAISQLPRPGLMEFLIQCESLFGLENMCVFTSVDERRFREVANKLVRDKYAPAWFKELKYIDWVGEHKDLRFVSDNINNVIIVDDYPPYIKQTQRHRLIQVSQYLEPYTHAIPDMADKELERLIEKLKSFMIQNDHI